MAIDLQFLYRQIRIYYPYPEDFPLALLQQAGLTAPELEAARTEPLLRVAKFDGRPVGVYLLVREGTDRFRMRGLAIAEDFRSRGLASWLVGHSLGVAETKGGREVVSAHHDALAGLLQRLGFVLQNGEWRMEIVAE